MVSDQNTPNSLKLLLVATLVIIVVTISLVMLYLSARQESFAKTQPYSIEIQVQASGAGELSAEYDYGFGFNAGHQQRFDISAGGIQTVSFTISAWKALQSLQLSSDTAMMLNKLTIRKYGAEYLALDVASKLSKDSPRVFDDIDSQLIGRH